MTHTGAVAGNAQSSPLSAMPSISSHEEIPPPINGISKEVKCTRDSGTEAQ